MALSSSPMPWIKVYTEILDDPKMRPLSPALKWRFVEMCLVAGECDAGGDLANGKGPLSLDDIAWRLRTEPGALELDLVVLCEHGLVRCDDGTWTVVSFHKRQGRAQSEKRSQWRQDQQRHREEELVGEPDVILESELSQHPREEKSREEKTIQHDPGGSVVAVADSLSSGQRIVLDLFGAKRYKNKTQAQAVLNLEEQFGLERVRPAAEWAAKQGMGLGRAIVSMERAVPKWGTRKRAEDATVLEGA